MNKEVTVVHEWVDSGLKEQQLLDKHTLVNVSKLVCNSDKWITCPFWE